MEDTNSGQNAPTEANGAEAKAAPQVRQVIFPNTETFLVWTHMEQVRNTISVAAQAIKMMGQPEMAKVFTVEEARWENLRKGLEGLIGASKIVTPPPGFDPKKTG